MLSNNYLLNQVDDLQQLQMMYLPPGEVDKHSAFNKHCNNNNFRDRYLKSRFNTLRFDGCYLHMITFEELVGEIKDLVKIYPNTKDFNKQPREINLKPTITYKNVDIKNPAFDDFWDEVLAIYLKKQLFYTDIKRYDAFYFNCGSKKIVKHHIRFFDNYKGLTDDKYDVKLFDNFDQDNNLLLHTLHLPVYYFLPLIHLFDFNIMIDIKDCRQQMFDNFKDGCKHSYHHIHHNDKVMIFRGYKSLPCDNYELESQNVWLASVDVIDDNFYDIFLDG